MTALDWCRSAGIERFYLKYCSTFDSTDDGNIVSARRHAINRL